MLVRKEDAWTAAYLANKGTADESRHEKWRHNEIREALRVETSGKCAYCEGFVDDVSYPHVEHILPKAVRPELAHRWHNLTSACGRCNVAKGDFYDAVNGLLNPYEDPVERHLRFIGGLVHWELADERGEITVRKLQLNRFELVKARTQRLADVRSLLDRWHASGGPLRDSIAEALRLDAREGEFSQSVTAYLSHFGFPVDPCDQPAGI